MFLKVATMAALLLAPLYAQAPAKTETAAALPDAREIINRHIKAIGGREAILAHKSMHATGTLSVPSSGISGPMEIFGATDPDRVIVKTTFTGIGDIAEGFDGSHASAKSPMTGPMLKFGKLLKAMTVTKKVMGVEQKIALSTVEYDNVEASAFEPPAAIKTLIK